MKRIILLLSLLAIINLASSCSSTTNSTAPPSSTDSTKTKTIGAPTNVTASTIDQTSIKVDWARGANDNQTDTVIVMAGGVAVASVQVSSPYATSSLTGFHAGVVYTISIHSAGGVSPTILWTIQLSIGGPPTGLMVTSTDHITLAFSWTRSPSDVGTDTVIITGGTANIGTIEVPSPGAREAISGLVEGTVYTVSVHSTGGASASVQWAPAMRSTGIRLWEYSAPSSVGNSGLQLASSNGLAAAVPANASNLSSVDFILGNDPSLPSGLVLQSADVISTQYHQNALSDSAFYVPTGLDGFFTARDLSTYSYVSGGAETSIPNDAVYLTQGWKMKLVKTFDNHYAKIAIKPQPDGRLYGTSGGYKFIDIEVSYQRTASEPYAARPEARRNGPGHRHMTQ